MRDQPDDELERFDRLRVWRRGGERAPHKPLLVLLMLARLDRERLVPFADVEADLRMLLRDFGPPAGSVHPEYPFWFLQSDGIWEVDGAEGVPPEQRRRGPAAARLRELAAGFTPSVHARLRADPERVRQIARSLLDAHFPASFHDDILDRVGLALDTAVRANQCRDPRFRLDVLRAYEYRCAVCGYDGKLDAVPVGLDAAHVRWWAAGGPDTVTNGLALCVLHHKALDLGIIGIDPDRRVLVSTAYHGSHRAHEYVTRFAGSTLAQPQLAVARVAEAHRRWHARQVFRTPPRDHARAAEASVPYEPG